MPRQETVIQVFVASPGDLAEERGALEEVILELNATWSRNLRCRYDLLRWETHAVPGIAEDAQAVVNETVPQDYDVFIGLLWSRFGTPTTRFDSGTEEEFEQAFKRQAADPAAIDLMFYFKDAPLPPSQLDPEQLAKVQEFKTRLTEIGALRGDFETCEDFKNLIRVHLSRIAQRWAAGAGEAADSEPTEPVAALPESDETPDDDAGLLDLMDDFNDAIERLNSLAERMTATTEEIGERMNQRAAEVTALNPESGSYDIKAAKRITARAAADLDEYVARTDADTPIFADSIATAMESFGRAASLSVDVDGGEAEDLGPMICTLASLADTFAESKDSLQSFRDSVAQMPRMTSVLNKSKRRALVAIDALIREFNVGVTRMQDLRAILQEVSGDGLDPAAE